MDTMLNESAPAGALGAAMSSLMDGDLAGDPLAQAMGAWRREPQARATWHTYHLIGDVLRSDDLANPPAHDAAFLQALRGKLAQEPVPLAPLALPVLAQPPRVAAAVGGAQRAPGALRGGRSWSSWLVAPTAVAAGFVAVAGLLVASRVVTVNPSDSAPLVSANTAGANSNTHTGTAQQATVATAASGGALVRNVSLDRYLEAHRSLSNGMVAAGGAEHRVHITFESK